MIPNQDNAGTRTALTFLRSLSFASLCLVVVLFSGIIARLAWQKLTPEPETSTSPTTSTPMTLRKSSRPAQTTPEVTAPAEIPATPQTHTALTVKPTPAPTPEPIPQAVANPPAVAPQTQLVVSPPPVTPAAAPKRNSIYGRVMLVGNPPPEKPLPWDAICGQAYPRTKPTTQFYRVGKDRGLADVFVWVTEGVPKQTYPVPETPLVIDQIGCVYVPYVSAVQTKQTIRVKNSDSVLHNVHPSPQVAGNPESNKAQLPRSSDLVYQWSQPEVFLKYKCDVHPWMFAYVSVVDHPYFAVTDQEGRFNIAELPPGEYTVEAYHRKAGRLSRKVTVTKNGLLEMNFELPVEGLQQAAR